MTLEYGHGDLLAADVDALVNPVNTQGVMGKGLALQFKQAFPEVVPAYVRACKDGTLVPGKVQIVHRGETPHYIVHFPTKQHWRSPAKLEYVREGLADLVEQLGALTIGSIAIPPLGCGLGGLDWADVKPLIVDAFVPLPQLRVVLFEPAPAPAPAVKSRSRTRG